MSVGSGPVAYRALDWLLVRHRWPVDGRQRSAEQPSPRISLRLHLLRSDESEEGRLPLWSAMDSLLGARPLESSVIAGHRPPNRRLQVGA